MIKFVIMAHVNEIWSKNDFLKDGMEACYMHSLSTVYVYVSTMLMMYYHYDIYDF